MKQFAAMISVLTLLLLLTACRLTPPTERADDGRLSIVTTNFPGYDFARQIAGEYADITMLLPPGTESHSFEPTMQDIITIQNCDIFFYVGGESEHWADSLLDSMDTSRMTIVSMMGIVEPLEEEWKEGMTQDHDHDHDHDEPAYDEHVWTSPRNVVKLCEGLLAALIDADSTHAPAYQAAHDQYRGELDALDGALAELMAQARRTTLVFGDRFPFRYLVEDYGLDYYAAFPGCADETEPSAQTLVYLIDKVRQEQIPVVFTIEFSGGKIADTICESTGAAKLLLHSAHNVTRDEFDSGVTYVDIMKQNIINLREAVG